MPCQPVADGARLAVRLTPRSHRNGLVGVIADADGRPILQLRLVAPPVEGAANKALIAYLAESLQLRKSDIRLLSGETSRVKMVHLAGNPGMIATRVQDWITSTS